MIIIKGSYIQYAEGYDKDDITRIEIVKALKDLVSMDDEHSAFWVGVYGSDNVEFILELHKNLTLFGKFGEDDNYKIQLQSLEQSKFYFDLLLTGMIEELIENIKGY